MRIAEIELCFAKAPCNISVKTITLHNISSVFLRSVSFIFTTSMQLFHGADWLLHPETFGLTLFGVEVK